MALENLAIAEDRTQLRYLRVRSADYQPRLQHFYPGQFVYVQAATAGHSTLQPRAQLTHPSGGGDGKAQE